MRKDNKNTPYKRSNTVPAAIKDDLEPIFMDLSTDSLFKKCLHDQTQNANEALH